MPGTSEHGLDEIFFALSHRVRRRMLSQLSRAPESRVTDLARQHRLSLNSVSKHIAVLERSRLVRRRRDGREHLIRLDLDQLARAQRWIDEHRRFWADRLDSLARYIESTQQEKGPDDGTRD